MKRIFCSILLVSLISMGCHKSASVPPPAVKPVAIKTSPPPAVTPSLSASATPAPLEPAPISKTITKPSSLDLGETSFQIGKYAQAAKAYEDYLKDNPKSAMRDRALFQLGLSKALAGDSIRDLHLAEAVFKKLIFEFPSSPYRDQAELILGLQNQVDKLKTDIKDREEKIKKLSEELQKLKEIDLQRRPSRPHE
jgi:hypothetical protein